MGNTISHEANHPQADETATDIIDRAEASLYGLRGTDPRGGAVAIDLAIDEALIAADAAAQAPGGLLGLSHGLTELDRLTGGISPATLNVIGARPGMGKTSLGLSVALSVAQQGGGVLFVSLEMSRKQIGIRAATALAWETDDSIAYNEAMRGTINADQQDRLRQAREGQAQRHVPPGPLSHTGQAR